MEESWYNPADEIIVVVTLKRPGPAGGSFLNYAFENRADGTAFIAHYLFACAGVRTANRQIHAVTNRIRQGNDNKASAIIMSSQHRRREAADLASRRKVRVPLYPRSES